jgi:hypothetical protein
MLPARAYVWRAQGPRCKLAALQSAQMIGFSTGADPVGLVLSIIAALVLIAAWVILAIWHGVRTARRSGADA